MTDKLELLGMQYTDKKRKTNRTETYEKAFLVSSVQRKQSQGKQKHFHHNRTQPQKGHNSKTVGLAGI